MKKIKQSTLSIVIALMALVSGCTVNSQEEQKITPVFTYDESTITGAKPWTSENFANKSENFQFVIIGDRTGGANALGTFDRALDQINLLQPEFVINVGDLIEGYPIDENDLNSQWEESDKMISKLQVPFFYTVGNHDVSSKEMKEAWLKRRGVDYYHFVYNDVLFMVLNTEDDSRPTPPPEIMEGIKVYNKLQLEDPAAAKEMLKEFMTDEAVVAALGQAVGFPEEQMDWIKQTLTENTDVRWTFLFMHEPCWENPSESFMEIQQMLKDRKHTFFAGHLHYYDYDKIDGHEHITMGPAGASFHHDGPGNVDHLMWVTMTNDGPQMGNIALKGIFNRMGLDTAMFGAYDRKGY